MLLRSMRIVKGLLQGLSRGACPGDREAVIRVGMAEEDGEDAEMGALP